MKKYFLYTACLCISAFIVFTAFKKTSPAIEKQNAEIQTAVEENLTIFTSEKEAECRAKALKAAVLRVANMEKEKKADLPVSKPKIPSTAKPKPVAPTNTTTTPPPVPQPTTDAEPVPETPATNTAEPSTADPATGTNVGKKENPKTEDPVEKAKSGVNKGKKGGN